MIFKEIGHLLNVTKVMWRKLIVRGPDLPYFRQGIGVLAKQPGCDSLLPLIDRYLLRIIPHDESCRLRSARLPEDVQTG